MPKIPWTPPPRPPRIKLPKPPEDFTPVSQNRCEDCVGMGVLYSNRDSGQVEIVCWVCKGTGSALPPPPDGALRGDATFDPPPFTGSTRTDKEFMERYDLTLDVFPETDDQVHPTSNIKRGGL